MVSFIKLSSGKPIYEHCGGFEGPGEIITDKLASEAKHSRMFLGQNGKYCFLLIKNEIHEICLRTFYYVGVDWINPEQLAIYVKPKFDADSKETDYFFLLNKILGNPHLNNHIEGLFEIFPNEPLIQIEQKQDIITPLIVYQFLTVLKEIVRKGLKHTYYKVDENLQNKVKGKILVTETIKRNDLKAQFAKTVCRYQVFGINGNENRLLKKAIQFIRLYQSNPKSGIGNWTQPMLSYVDPAFLNVSDNISIHYVKHGLFNPFYQEYKEAIDLAKLILQRFGFSISETYNTDHIKIPPFWIDMSRLFELYVLTLLKDSFGNEVEYHVSIATNELDFLLKENEYQMVIDSKYKRYSTSSINKNDAWQVSAYARLNSVYNILNRKNDKLIDALIIYPDPKVQRTTLNKIDLDCKVQDPNYKNLYKLALKIPQK